MAQKHWCGYQRSALVGRVSAARAALYVMYDARSPAARRASPRTHPRSADILTSTVSLLFLF